MNVERRLQHAARELREVPIAVPPLGPPPRARRVQRNRLVPALAAPILFVAGGVFTLGAGGVGQPTHSDVDAVVRPATESGSGGDTTTGATPTEPSADFELELIEQMIVDGRPDRPSVGPRPDEPASPTGAGPM